MVGTADCFAWLVLSIRVYAVPSVIAELGVSALRWILVGLWIEGVNI